ncbi:MAG: hypothetical protein H6598_06125 [Flavobacteriales bacterium]|nr:hypothetical protein [Flavobacteriales bacterium]MCB9195780.1 hypothetical protein [Flavobacteriales bacterium]
MKTLVSVLIYSMTSNNSEIQLIVSNSAMELNTDLQLKVFKQIEKDANMIGEEYVVDETQNLLSWWNQLLEFLTELIEFGDVRNLLYRIDVSEVKIRQIGTLTIQDIGILVVKRELEKVLLREKYS